MSWSCCRTCAYFLLRTLRASATPLSLPRATRVDFHVSVNKEVRAYVSVPTAHYIHISIVNTLLAIVISQLYIWCNDSGRKAQLIRSSTVHEAWWCCRCWFSACSGFGSASVTSACMMCASFGNSCGISFRRLPTRFWTCLSGPRRLISLRYKAEWAAYNVLGCWRG